MERVIAAGLLAMVLSIIAGPRFIDFLRRKELGQHIREEGPEGHRTKQGTPTMGGILIVLAATLPFLVFSLYTLSALTVFAVALACAGIGFLDDFMKARRRRSLGLAGRWKLLLLGGITVFLVWAALEQGLDTDIYIPALGQLDLSWLWYALVFFIVAGAANGVNLTDGVDGLAAGTGIIALLTYTALPVIAFIRQRGDADLDLAILGAALIGGTIGFLWYNAFPAEVFMGDTGSMAIGGALAGFAVMTNTESLLPLIGGIFLVEALSVMIQVFAFKYSGRRVFLMTPIHHHFEMKAWSETKIMVRFWILTAILCGSGFALYYQYYLSFRP
jgi:phospho-N-acetylmuramoyl-pentapeptide-transferase